MSVGKTSGRYGEKGGENGQHRYVQTLVSPQTHKALVMLALDRGCSLAALLGDIVINFLKERK